MARTSVREIVRVCADIARLDRKGKQEVFDYLNDELKSDIARTMARNLASDLSPKPVTYREGEK